MRRINIGLVRGGGLVVWGRGFWMYRESVRVNVHTEPVFLLS